MQQTILDLGVNDCWVTSIQMKKGRPAHQVNVLCQESQLKSVEQVLLSESSTIGLRYFPVTRCHLPRETVVVEMAGQKIRVKVCDGSMLGSSEKMGKKFKAEFEDCRRLSAQTGVSLRQIAADAELAAEKEALKGESFSQNRFSVTDTGR